MRLKYATKQKIAFINYRYVKDYLIIVLTVLLQHKITMSVILAKLKLSYCFFTIINR